MAYDSTTEFVTALEAAGELKRISAEVDPILEITEIADRSVKRGGPALLFESVKGHNIPLLINALGSEKRMCMALGVDTFEADPISFFCLATADYLEVGRRIGALGLPTLYVMEGGYAVDEIGANTVNVLSGHLEA